MVKEKRAASTTCTSTTPQKSAKTMEYDPIMEYYDRLEAEARNPELVNKDDDYPEHPQKDLSEDYRRQNLKLANKALESYNKKNRTKYELVEAINSCGFLCPGVWAHCNFTAKPIKTTPHSNGDEKGDGNGDSSTKLFFAELCNESFKWVVTTCRVFRGKPGSCEFCKNDEIKHPSHGVQITRWPDDEPYDLRPRTRG